MVELGAQDRLGLLGRGAAVGVEVVGVVVQLQEAERGAVGLRPADGGAPEGAGLVARRGGGVDGVGHGGRERLLAVAVDRVDERLLGREVAVDRAHRDAGAPGDLRHPGAVEAALGEQGERGAHDRVPAVGRRIGGRRQSDAIAAPAIRVASGSGSRRPRPAVSAFSRPATATGRPARQASTPISATAWLDMTLLRWNRFIGWRATSKNPVAVTPGHRVVQVTPEPRSSWPRPIPEGDDLRLAGAVGSVERRRLEGRDGGHVQHPAPAARQHAGQRQVRQVHQRDDVDLLHPADAVPVGVGERPVDAEARVVDEDVHAREVGLQGEARVRVGEVGRPHDGLAGADLGRQALQRLGANVPRG